VVVKGKWGSAACAVALTVVAALAAGCSSGSTQRLFVRDRSPAPWPPNYGPAETTTLNVGVVPAMDSAGFFVAQNEGLFAKEGLHDQLLAGDQLRDGDQPAARRASSQISAGNYVSYIDGRGQGRPSSR
jgi:ABC-type nitrate/sulfonate/bicarbonate transport system substrate-binding protein